MVLYLLLLYRDTYGSIFLPFTRHEEKRLKTHTFFSYPMYGKKPPKSPQNTPFYIYALKYPFDSFLEQNTHFYPPKHTLLRVQKRTPKDNLLCPQRHPFEGTPNCG